MQVFYDSFGQKIRMLERSVFLNLLFQDIYTPTFSETLVDMYRTRRLPVKSINDNPTTMNIQIGLEALE